MSCWRFPRDFEKDWVKGEAPRLLVAANAVNGTKGSLGGSYLSSIISDYTRELGSESSSQGLAGKPLSRVDITTQNLYNPTLNYKLFMIPALMVMLLTLICGFLPCPQCGGREGGGHHRADKCHPVGKFTFIAAKLIPYWLIGFVVLTICFVLAWVLYGILPAGHSSLSTAWRCFSTDGVGVRAGHIQSFDHVAAGHVCHVVLHAYPYSDEWSFHPYPQYA